MLIFVWIGAHCKRVRGKSAVRWVAAGCLKPHTGGARHDLPVVLVHEHNCEANLVSRPPMKRFFALLLALPLCGAAAPSFVMAAPRNVVLIIADDKDYAYRSVGSKAGEFAGIRAFPVI